MNVPVEMRLATMEANLRRLQQQGRDWGHTYVAVNIAAARYRLIKDGETLFEQVVVVAPRHSARGHEISSLLNRNGIPHAFRERGTPLADAVLRAAATGDIDAYVAAIQRGDVVAGYELTGYWSDVGTPERYAQAEHDAFAMLRKPFDEAELVDILDRAKASKHKVREVPG